MLDLERYQKDNSAQLIRLFKEKPDAVVALMARENGNRYICRIYTHPVPGYEAACGLTLPELPRLYRCTALDGSWLVEEEFVDGIRLSELLEVYHPDERQTAAIAARLCLALNALHKKGIVHRDVKPENVLITSTGRVVLIDLDATSHLDAEKSRDTRLLGTVGYAAPEQFGFGRSDVRTDIFSMGVLMNTMLTGEHPSQKLAIGSLRPIIERCISVNADQRYHSAQTLRQDILPLAGEDTVCPECGFTSPGGGCLCCGRASQAKEKTPSRSAAWLSVLAAAILFFALGLGAGQLLFPREVADTEKTKEVAQFAGEYAVGLVSVDLENETLCFSPAYDFDGIPKDIAGDRMVLMAMPDPENNLYAPASAIRLIAPALWRATEGGLTPAEDMAHLLENPSVTLYRLSGNGNVPKIMEYGKYMGVWDGAVSMIFDYSCCGKWLVEVKATIQGREYSAYAITTVLDTFPE